jgi:hypothetical protein
VCRRITILLAVIGGVLVLSGVAAPLAAAEPAYDVEPPEVSLAPGLRLNCNPGSWNGTGITFSYTWLRDGATWATGSVYSLTNADKGHTFTCIVVGRNNEGSEEEESWNAFEYGGGAPKKPEAGTPPPEISGVAKAAEAKVGETLECKHGGWTGTPAPTYTYQWLREGQAIAGATASTYTVAKADQGFVLACSVTATNSAGSASKQSSNTVKVAGEKLVDETAPSVAPGTGGVGQQLTCKSGQWKGAPPPTFTYQWLREKTEKISGATGSTYTIVEADQLHAISCEVTAESGSEKASAKSSNEVKVPGSPPSNTELPTVVGAGKVGAKLTCEPGKWSGAPKPEPPYKYQWLRGSEAIASATSASYTVVSEDAGLAVSCEVTAKNSVGSAVATSKGLVIEGESHTDRIPENITPPTVSGEPSLGKTLSCSKGTWNAEPPIETYTYRWLREGTAIATTSTYMVTEEDLGLKLVCQVNAKNPEGSASANSERIQIKGVKPKPKTAPSILGALAVGETLTCSPGTWEGVPKPTFSYHWMGITGTASSNSYRVLEGDRGRQLSCEVTATNFEGSASAQSAAVEIPAIGPRIESGPIVTGASPPVPGTTLTCNSKWSGKPTPTISYAWLTDGGRIEGANASTYVVTKFDEGHHLACEVTATNSAGTERAISKRIAIPGSAPEDVEAPSVSGQPQIGELLTCEPGLWHGKPAPTLTYQWLLNGSEIPGATEQTYIAEASELGSYISCAVTATNTEGSNEAWSENAPEIVPRSVKKLEVPIVPPFTKETNSTPPTTAQILAALEKQLLAALKKARRSGLLKSGSYSFSFLPPTGGRLEFLWLQTPKPSKASAKPKPVLLARVRSTFGIVSAQTQKLRLTLAGRRALKASTHPKLTVEGVFVPAGGKPVTWSKTIVLSG